MTSSAGGVAYPDACQGDEGYKNDGVCDRRGRADGLEDVEHGP
jgi:hypothetical protein